MRIHTTVVTKDHFLVVLQSTHRHDELYAAENYPSENPIGFLAEGSAITFKKDSTTKPWVKYADSLTGPILHIRSVFSLFGAVASENKDLTYLTIMPRSDNSMALLKKLGQEITPKESEEIETSDNSFQLGLQCRHPLQRDLNTFALGSFDVAEDVGEIDFDGI